MSPRSGSKSPFIRRIYVNRLFGQYTYELLSRGKGDESLDPLLILYGDNGSGKTTILKLLFNLLGYESGRGQKTYVARCMFHEFRVDFSDGLSVIATRQGDSLLGSFRMTVVKRQKMLAQIDWKVDETIRIVSKQQDARRQVHIFKTLEGLKLGLCLLTDDRQVFQIPKPAEEERDGLARTRVRKSGLTVGRLGKEADVYGHMLEAALGRVSRWATDKTLQGSAKGDIDANALYEETVRRLSKAVKEKHRGPSGSREELIKELNALSQRSEAYARYGLIGPIRMGVMVSILETVDSHILETIQTILLPYIESVRARLDALSSLHDAIEAFLGVINGFYRDKEVVFDLKLGMTFRSRSGTMIPPLALSSGERQLLMLFSNVLVALERRSIFIVDEPELSLNVKWQRRLIDALLDFSKGAPVQFILATHSIELLSRYQRHVVRLGASTE